MPRDAGHGRKLKSLNIEKRGTKRTRRKTAAKLREIHALQGLNSIHDRLLDKE